MMSLYSHISERAAADRRAVDSDHHKNRGRPKSLKNRINLKGKGGKRYGNRIAQA
jgi:hypothetical protein